MADMFMEKELSNLDGLIKNVSVQYFVMNRYETI